MHEKNHGKHTERALAGLSETSGSPSGHAVLLVFFVIAYMIHPDVSPVYAEGETPAGEPMVVEVIKLDYADAEHVASVIRPLLSKQGRVVTYKATNTIIIRDRASIVREMKEIIKGRDENPDDQDMVRPGLLIRFKPAF